MNRHFKPSPSRRPRSQNRIRIIGGVWRSRLLEFPEAAGLRPTGDRVRETLFNWLGQTLHGRRCLDLFAGSGALGFEAASRGAEHVVMVECHAEAFRSLEESKQILGARQCDIRRGDAAAFIRDSADTFDVIFVDPPFGSDLLVRVLGDGIGERLSANGVMYVESGVPIEKLLDSSLDRGWQVVKQGKAGVVHFALLGARVSDV